MQFHCFYFCCILLYHTTFCYCAEPITAGIAAIGAVAVSLGYAGWSFINCKQNECCDDYWIKLNYVGLEEDLRRNIFGQHFVNDIVPRSLKAHIDNKEPKKALVMSFHGWTGSGKNYVSQMITKNLFKKGTSSAYHHFYVGSRSFPHKQDINKYRDQLHKDIEAATKICGRSLFVFDEVDKMAPEVLDALKPYIDYHHQLDGVDYRKNIFIFLSNSGGSNITAVALKFWADGRSREDITLKDMEPLISMGAFNEVGGLHHSELVKRDLIDIYVPFLPLEKKHVKKCVDSELRAKGKTVTEDKLEKIASELVYAPPETELFSTSGCKKISQKVDIFG